MNKLRQEAVDDPEIATRIAQYEMAFRMQTSVPELMDLAKEPKQMLDMYGTTGSDGSFAANCLLARRLAERGVRFIQVYHRDWDMHGALKRDMPVNAKETDQATAALIKDLKQRDMLKDTIVVWGGEFGRTPMNQGDGRDHHIKGFSMWVAGGGFKPGITWGETDELGYNAVKDVVEVHDLHATMLYLLGIDHERMTYRYQGRDFRLTDVAGKVIGGILDIRGVAGRLVSPGTATLPPCLLGGSAPAAAGRHAAGARTDRCLARYPGKAGRCGSVSSANSPSAMPSRVPACHRPPPPCVDTGRPRGPTRPATGSSRRARPDRHSR